METAPSQKEKYALLERFVSRMPAGVPEEIRNPASWRLYIIYTDLPSLNLPLPVYLHAKDMAIELHEQIKEGSQDAFNRVTSKYTFELYDEILEEAFHRASSAQSQTLS